MLVAFDPGVTTGYVAYNKYEDSYTSGHIDCASLLHFYTWLRMLGPSEMVVEQFQHRPQMIKAELHGVKVIGIVELYSEQHQVPILDYYLPAQAKKFWTDQKIKALHLWKPGKEHAMDAMRVLLTLRMNTDPEWFSKTMLELR